MATDKWPAIIIFFFKFSFFFSIFQFITHTRRKFTITSHLINGQTFSRVICTFVCCVDLLFYYLFVLL